MLIIKVAIIAFVYGVILMENGMIGSYMYRFFENKFGNIDQDWRFKFWLSCEKCIAGQMALWIYPLYHPYRNAYGIFEHVFFISAVILCVVALKRLYERTNRVNS